MRAAPVVIEKLKKTPKLVHWEKSSIVAACAERDGWHCCYCTRKLTRGSATIEHFVARSVGGPNHQSNYGLACSACNAAVADKPVAQKIRYAFECGRKRKYDHTKSTIAFVRERNERVSA